MNGLHQDFRKPVKYVAGRDVNHHKTTIFSLAEQRPESQLQAEFEQRTRIWCPKPAREWLETLMEEHCFTARELSVAWRNGSIGWNAEKDEKRIVTPWIEAAFAYGVIVILALYFLSLAYHFIFGPGAGMNNGMALLYGVGAMYFGMCWMANRFMLWPRRVALRVRRTECR